MNLVPVVGQRQQATDSVAADVNRRSVDSKCRLAHSTFVKIVELGTIERDIKRVTADQKWQSFQGQVNLILARLPGNLAVQVTIGY